MATTITVGGTDIDYQDYSITVPVSSSDIAPSATITTDATETIAANDDVVITIDGTDRFVGKTRSGGTKSTTGGTSVKAAHAARELFEETVDITQTGPPSSKDVLDAALSNANSGSSFTLDYAGTATTLNDDYEVTERTVRRVFRDMADRTDRVWWVDPAGSTIHFENLGARGTWKSINTKDDRASITQFDSGSINTVRNVVTVVGTGAVSVEATITDSTSISNYGRRPAEEPYKVSYILSPSEAQALADELIISDPLPEGTLLVGTNVGTIDQPLANYQIDVTDNGLNVDANNLAIVSQTIEQGRARLDFGAGKAKNIENRNRRTKSREDNAPPGTVMPEERIEDNAISSTKLADLSVTEAKLDDLAVALDKVQDGAIDTVKITDDAIETPKILAEAVTASEILADTITANEIAADTITALEIVADTITANEIDAGTITANEIDTLNLNTGELSVEDSSVDAGFEWVTANLPVFGDSADMNPTGSGTVTIGAQNNFDSVNANNLNGEQLNLEKDNLIADIDGVSISQGIAIEEENSDTIELRPSLAPADTTDTARLGNATEFWDVVYADSYITQSPPEIDSVDLSTVTDRDWYDNPPEPVMQTARDIGRADTTIPDGSDHAPVDLGTMANWLLETCKAQQERIDSLENTVADLTERLSRLEEQV